MLLWGQFTVLAFVTGLVAAVVVTRVFRLPPVELSGRVNLWYGVVFVLSASSAPLVRGSLTVAWQVLDWRRQPGAAIIAVPLRIDDDLIMTHTAVTASLIPGSLIVDADRDRRILYLHVIGVRSDARCRARSARACWGWERRIVRAVGSRAQVERVSRMPRPRMQGGCAVNILLLIAIYVVFAVAALLTLWRIVIGPSILDRAVASDVLLTQVMCVLGAEMAINHHTRSLPVLLIIAARRGLRLDLDRPVRREKGQRRAMIDHGCRARRHRARADPASARSCASPPRSACCASAMCRPDCTRRPSRRCSG